MACRPHPTGGHRAYKKINGVEVQIYSRDRKIAEAKQRELDALAALKPTRVFSNCGRLIGFRIRQHRNGGINMEMQLKNHRGTKSLSANSFETVWKWVRDNWKTGHNLTSGDVASYTTELKSAKRIYLQDLAKITQ
ncbi:hypothetical protein [Sessilibacter sp. MAH2]